MIAAVSVTVLALAVTAYVLAPLFRSDAAEAERAARALSAEDHRSALGVLRTSLIVETLCAALILGLVAWLGTLEPIPA